jgi:GAF domain-containing protein
MFRVRINYAECRNGGDGSSTVPRMRIPPGPRVYLTTTVSLVAVALATWLGMEAGSAPASAMQWWILGAVIASVVAAGVPAYEQIRKERLRVRAERAALDAAVAMRVTMNDALDPIVRQLGRIATAGGRHDREALQEATIPMILDSAAHLIEAERVRACWFKLIEGKPAALVPDQYAGRADEPRTTFTQGTVEGDYAFTMIRHNEHLVCADVDTDPPPGWPVARHTYKSFIAVPVVAGHKPFGMLTVDTVDIAGVSEAEVPLVRLLAGLLADALAYE